MYNGAVSDSDDFDPGELVLAEKPLFKVPAEAHNSDLDQYLESALEVPVFVFVFAPVFVFQLVPVFVFGFVPIFVCVQIFVFVPVF